MDIGEAADGRPANEIRPRTMATKSPRGLVMMSRDEQTVHPTQTAPMSQEPKTDDSASGCAGGRTMSADGRARTDSRSLGRKKNRVVGGLD